MLTWIEKVRQKGLDDPPRNVSDMKRIRPKFMKRKSLKVMKCGSAINRNVYLQMRIVYLQLGGVYTELSILGHRIDPPGIFFFFALKSMFFSRILAYLRIIILLVYPLGFPIDILNRGHLNDCQNTSRSHFIVYYVECISVSYN